MSKPTGVAQVFAPFEGPGTPLGRYRTLGPNCGLKVSPLCLGAMNFGDAWEEFMGKCDKTTTFEILDAFYKAGGNFIDTANNYQEQQSEQWIGDWMEERGNRDDLVIATKYTTNFAGRSKPVNTSYVGNSFKNQIVSVNASLKKLKTSYIDILYLHWWDMTTPVEEVMNGLNTLVQQGKVLYLGVSDTPAWIVAKANMYARQHGLAQFTVFQGRWNAADRALEQEILPMCRDFGMGIAPWAAIGGGNFKTKEQRESNEGRNMGGPSPLDIKVSEALEKIAAKKNTLITSVALAYVKHAYPYTFPIIGGRNLKHLQGNIDALNLELSKEDMEEIEAANDEFKYTFPQSMMFGQSKPSTSLTSSNVGLLRAGTTMDAAPHQGTPASAQK